MRKLASLTGLAMVLALAGCGAPDERRAEDPLAAARALVPEDVRAAGKLTVASDLMFEVVVAMLDADVLFGRLTATSAPTDRQLCAEITDVALHILGLDPVAEPASTIA